MRNLIFLPISVLKMRTVSMSVLKDAGPMYKQLENPILFILQKCAAALWMKIYISLCCIYINRCYFLMENISTKYLVGHDTLKNKNQKSSWEVEHDKVSMFKKITY